ncbi:putative sugar phosphate/phosphate translocator [Citrus sinensis]|nr:putative sugar phosphate/phosphate translocator [Citrus sinensis]
MTACLLLSYAAVAVMKVAPMQRVNSQKQLLKICVLFLLVSFNQAIGAMTPFFTAVSAYLMSNKREAWVGDATLAPAVAGVTVARRVNSLICDLTLVSKMLDCFFCFFNRALNNFHLFGFIMCVSATAARAFNSEKLNSMNLLMYMAPIAVLFLLPATLEDAKMVWYLLFNSSLVYFVNLTNFLVTKNTSALTLQECIQVLGNARGVVAVVVSILILEILCR